MERTGLMIIFIVFVLTFTGLVANMPTELYSSGFDSQLNIPEQFDAWTEVPTEISLNGTLSKNSFLELDYTQYFETSQKYRFEWETLFVGRIYLYKMGKPVFGQEAKLELEFWVRSELVDAWNPLQNYSYFELRSYGMVYDIYFEDNDGSRNDIGASFDAGILNITMVAPRYYETSDTLTAREIVLAILTFQLPTIFSSLHPVFGFVISVMFYVPIAFIFFTVIIMLLHG